MFAAVKKAVRNIGFNRHRPEEFGAYLKTAHERMTAVLERHGKIEVKLEASTLMSGGDVVATDDQRENNLIYPLWAEGVRLLIFHRGIALEELLRFFALVIELEPREPGEDLVSALWKAEIGGVEWVAITDFDIQAGSDDEGEGAIELEVENVLQYLQRSMLTSAHDGLSFGRVALSDLELDIDDVANVRTSVTGMVHVTEEDRAQIQADLKADAERILDRIANVILDVMRVEGSAEELEDIAAGLEQILDALIYEGRFLTLDRLLNATEKMAYEAGLAMPNRDMARRISDRLGHLIQEGGRVRAVATSLNGERVDDAGAARRYLERFRVAPVILLELLEILKGAGYRRAVVDLIAEGGAGVMPVVRARLRNATPETRRNLFVVIDRVEPDDKVRLLTPMLSDDDPSFRVDVLASIARVGDEEAFDVVKRVFTDHKVGQLRAHAARLLGEFPPELAELALLEVAVGPEFDGLPEGERQAIISALSKLDAPRARAWIEGQFQEKSGMFAGKKKRDDKKLQVIRAVARIPSVANMELLSRVAQDTKTQSRPVCAAARDAVLRMRDQLLGSGAR